MIYLIYNKIVTFISKRIFFRNQSKRKGVEGFYRQIERLKQKCLLKELELKTLCVRDMYLYSLSPFIILTIYLFFLYISDSINNNHQFPKYIKITQTT